MPKHIPNRLTYEESWCAVTPPTSTPASTRCSLRSFKSTTIKCWHIECLSGLNLKDMGHLVWWCAHKSSPKDQARYSVIVSDRLRPAGYVPPKMVAAVAFSDSTVELYPFIGNCFHIYWMFKYYCRCEGECTCKPLLMTCPCMIIIYTHVEITTRNLQMQLHIPCVCSSSRRNVAIKIWWAKNFSIVSFLYCCVGCRQT